MMKLNEKLNLILKNMLKQAFDIFGLEIHKKNMPVKNNRTNLSQVLDHILEIGFNPQTVIDVGAANGTFGLYNKFPTARHILIEPLQEFEEDLKEISLKYNAKYIIAAAGSGNGNVKINIHPDLVGSSLFKEKEGRYVDGIEREVPMITINDLCKKWDLKGPCLIKIDVQGTELFVLDGATNILQDTEVIILEISLFNCVLGSPSVHQVLDYLKNRGFVVYDIFNFNYRPLDKALAQVDMVFVKENGIFRQDHSFATFEQRKEQFNKYEKFVDSRKIKISQ